MLIYAYISELYAIYHYLIHFYQLDIYIYINIHTHSFFLSLSLVHTRINRNTSPRKVSVKAVPVKTPVICGSCLVHFYSLYTYKLSFSLSLFSPIYDALLKAPFISSSIAAALCVYAANLLRIILGHSRFPKVQVRHFILFVVYAALEVESTCWDLPCTKYIVKGTEAARQSVQNAPRRVAQRYEGGNGKGCILYIYIYIYGERCFLLQNLFTRRV